MSDLIKTIFVQNCSAILGTILELLLAIILGCGARAITLLCKKFKLNVDSKMLESFESTVKKSVQAVNQKIVQDLKAASSDGKLTDDEKKQVKESAIEMAKTIMSTEVYRYIETHYGNIDNMISTYIEYAIKEVKETSLFTGFADIGETLKDYENITDDDIKNDSYEEMPGMITETKTV